MVAFLFLPPFHSFGDGILMRSGKRRKPQLAAVRLAVIHMHPRDFFIKSNGRRHILKIQLGVYPLGKHVQSQGNDIRVSGAFTVAEQGSLDPVRAGQQAQFAVRHAATPVVMGMEGDHHAVTVIQMLAHIFYLAGVNVRHGMLYCHRKIDNHLFLRRRLPDIQHSIADIPGKFHLRAGKAFRRILKPEIATHFAGNFLKQLGAVHSDPDNFLLALAEHLLPLGY